LEKQIFIRLRIRAIAFWKDLMDLKRLTTDFAGTSPVHPPHFAYSKALRGSTEKYSPS
jgi:hypothetical protein